MRKVKVPGGTFTPLVVPASLSSLASRSSGAARSSFAPQGPRRPRLPSPRRQRLHRRPPKWPRAERSAVSVLLASWSSPAVGSSAKSKRRDAVNAYLGRVQTIQLHYRPSFDLANQAYRDFSKGKTGKRQVERLRGAEVSILAARDALEAVSPPEDARKLHAELLQLYDLNAIARARGDHAPAIPARAVRNVLGNLADVNKSYQPEPVRLEDRHSPGQCP